MKGVSELPYEAFKLIRQMLIIGEMKTHEATNAWKAWKKDATTLLARVPLDANGNYVRGGDTPERIARALETIAEVLTDGHVDVRDDGMTDRACR